MCLVNGITPDYNQRRPSTQRGYIAVLDAHFFIASAGTVIPFAKVLLNITCLTFFVIYKAVLLLREIRLSVYTCSPVAGWMAARAPPRPLRADPELYLLLSVTLDCQMMYCWNVSTCFAPFEYKWIQNVWALRMSLIKDSIIRLLIFQISIV